MAKRARPSRSRIVTLTSVLALTAAGLAACSSDSGKTELIWYINPDSGGQDAVAEACSTDDYTITTQVLPQDAGQQRIQLARRLAAKDSAIDLMSIDPPYTAEFANAGFLADLPDDAASTVESRGTFQGAIDAATWNDELVVYPFWSNTQVLWYRKSFAEKVNATKDLEGGEVTWQQLIDWAEQGGGKIGVQANKYEGYSVWINALISGAGGSIVGDNTDAGVDVDVTIDSDAALKAAQVIESLADSDAAPSDLSIAQEGQAGSTFGAETGSFLVNWTYIYNNYERDSPGFKEDIGYTMYPRTVEGEDARPPYGGIGVGVSEYSAEKEAALEAAKCITEPANQGTNAALTGNMPASDQGYTEFDKLQKAEAEEAGTEPQYPEDLLQLFQDSVDAAAPRSVTPYWSDISGAILSRWHPPSGVDKDTPDDSASFIEEILHGERLL